MDNIGTKQHKQAVGRISKKVLTYSLFLGLVTILGCNSLSPPATQIKDPVASDKWTGKWQFKDPSSSQSVTFVLTPEGKLFFLPPASSTKSVAYEVPLTKISDSATLPPNTQILSFQEQFNLQAKNARQSEAKTYIGAMSRAQQAYYLENAKFATTLEELQIGIKPETENFSYKIVPQLNQSNVKTMMTATAKKPELKSYTAAVFLVDQNGEKITLRAMCETDNPSSTPPAMPSPPINSSAEINCPSGSHQVGR